MSKNLDQQTLNLLNAIDIKTAIRESYDSRSPIFIWGPPGVGKSDCVRQAAEELGVQIQDVRTTLLDPVDLRGVPSIAGEKTRWNPPVFLPFEGSGILFLDELNASPPLVQAACYQLILDRKLGEYIMPPGWMVVGAGNREQDRAVVHKMPSALANRFIHLQFEVDVDTWVTWALQHQIRTEVISYIRWKQGEALFNFDPQRNTIKAFPTPRSWHRTSIILSKGSPRNVEEALIAGTVGDGAAHEFFSFMNIYRKLPDPQRIIENPKTAPIPDETSVKYALCIGLAKLASKKTIEAIVQYAERLTAEFNVLLIKDAVRVDRKIMNTPAMASWIIKHHDVYL